MFLLLQMSPDNRPLSGPLLTRWLLLAACLLSIPGLVQAQDGPVCNQYATKLFTYQLSGVFALSGPVSNTIYAANSRDGLYISTDEGVSYTNINYKNGLPNELSGVFVSDNIIYVASYNDGLYMSADNGLTWTQKTSWDGIGTSYLTSVFVSGNTVYVGTDGGGLAISTDGGNTFKYYRTPRGLGNNTVTGIHVANSTLYAATAGGVSISTNGGNTFINKTTTNGLGSDYVNGIYATSAAIYAATNGGLSISTDGGSSFTNKTTSNGLGGNVVYSVYVIGNTVYAGTDNGISISSDGGNTFTTYTTANGLGANAVYSVFATSNSVYAAGTALSKCPACPPSVSVRFTKATPSPNTNQGVAVKLTASGATSYTWSTGATTPVITVQEAGPYSVTGTNSSCLTNARASTRVIVTPAPANSRQGPVCDTYTKNQNPGLIEYNYGISALAGPVSNTVYVAAYYAGVGVSTDGGNTFEIKKNGLVSDQVFGVYSQTSTTGNIVYAATLYGLGISTDGGNTFTNKTTANGLGNSQVRGVYAVGNTVYAATNGGLSISTDGGNTFTNKTTTNGLASNTVHKVYATDNTVYAGTIYGLGISTDGGNTFVNRTLANGLPHESIDAIYAVGNTVYVGTVGGLSISTDGGNTFTTRTSTANGLGGGNEAGLNAVTGIYVLGRTVYAATNTGLSISTDGGNTFTNYTTANGLSSNNTKGVTIAGNTIYVGTEGGVSFCQAPCSVSITAVPSAAFTNGGSVTLTASGATSYTWSNGSTANPVVLSNVTPATTLSVTGTTDQCSATASFGQTTRYVKVGGSGNGSSWAAASGDLQAMINASKADDIIWIAAGTYTPTMVPAGCTGCSAPRHASFVLKDGVSIYGGFPATDSPGMTDRNPATHTTILSGERGTDALTDNVRHVVILVNHTSANTRLDGITISGGYADPTSSSTMVYGDETFRDYDGAGLYAIKSAIQLTNVVFTRNTSYQGGGFSLEFAAETPLRTSITSCSFTQNTVVNGYGAGMADAGTGTLIKDCYFGKNVGRQETYGGGLYAAGFGGLRIDNCVFEDNQVIGEGIGGAIYTAGLSYSLVNSQFRRNIVNAQGYGGAIYDESYGDSGNSLAGTPVVIDNCLFEGNGSRSGDASGQTYYGGAIYFYGSLETHVSNCVFKENKANYGGGIYTFNDNSVVITDCRFENNAAVYDGSGYGGAVYTSQATTLERCVFVNNTSDYGAGAVEIEAPTAVINCLLVSNSAIVGGAIYNYESKLRLINSTLVNNTNTVSPQGTVNNSAGGARRATTGSPPPIPTIRTPKGVLSQRERTSQQRREARYQAALAEVNASINRRDTRLALTSGAGSGGIANYNAQLFITNSILWHNEGQLSNNNSTITVANSIIQDGLSGDITSLGGNSSADPLFTNASDPDGADNSFATADDGLRPAATSPAVNGGTVTEGVPADDITKTVRTGIPDIGAYEATTAVSVASLSASPPASINLNVTGCPAELSFTGTGKRFVVSGPGGYGANRPLRAVVPDVLITIDRIILAGTYTITVTGNTGQTPYTTTFLVTGTCP